jgi:hypothetical protein
LKKNPLSEWSWLRLATALAGGLAGLGAVLLPAAAPYLVPLSAGLSFWALDPPGRKISK